MERETEKPGFWQDKERGIWFSQQINNLKKEIEEFEELEVYFDLLKESGQEKDVIEFERMLRKKELEVFLSGRYDRGNAILSIFSGAGGEDAQDWATLLLRMYERYCIRKGFQAKILHQSFGEGVGPDGRIGTKSATLEIKGRFAFGFLKRESGVHRLVRISPFSPKALRHTSFALVEVLPEISPLDEAEIKVNPADVKIETFKASGPGGQYVNKRETAVRIIHLPTGIRASCQSERSLFQNREKAMRILLAKLHQLKIKEKSKELEKIKGKPVSIGWGNQIRSYVFHPYHLVKDLRTGVETSEVEKVLDGEIDPFIEAEIRTEIRKQSV